VLHGLGRGTPYGNKAIAVYEERQEEIDVVLLDIVMPNLGGVATLKILRRINSRVSVVVMSGYDDQETQQRLARAEVSGFVSKPLGPREVARAIQGAMPARDQVVQP